MALMLGVVVYLVVALAVSMLLGRMIAVGGSNDEY